MRSVPFACFAVLLSIMALLPATANAQTCYDSDTSAQTCQWPAAPEGTAPSPNTSMGVQLNSNTSTVLFNNQLQGYPCVFISNNDLQNTYFLPQGSAPEFNAFLSNPPTGVAFANCVPPLTNSTAYATTPSAPAYKATPSAPATNFTITAEGQTPPTAESGGSVAQQVLQVPASPGLFGGITPIALTPITTQQTVTFQYTRLDCISGTTQCNTWAIEEVQTITFTANPTLPAVGVNSSWSPKVASLYYISPPTSPPSWTPITVNGTPGSYNNDYQPPALLPCTVDGTSYPSSSNPFSILTTSTASPTVAECPYGAGTRVDDMQTATNYECDNGTTTVLGATTTETGFTGACTAAPPAGAATVFVIDAGNGRVEAFNLAGDFLYQFSSLGTGSGQIENPCMLMFNQAGNLLVSGGTDNDELIYTPSGTFMTQLGDADGYDLYSVGGGVQTPDGNYWVMSEAGDAMVVYNSSYTPLASYGGFNNPGDVALDPNGNVWVSNSGSNNILELNSSGDVVFTLGSTGTGAGQFNFPKGKVWDSSGRLWVVDSNNNRVQVFDTSYNFLFQFGTTGSGPGQFNRPYGIAIDPSGDIWITDSNNNRLEEFDESGNFLFQFGTSGTSPGQFSNPIGIAIAAGSASGASCTMNGTNYSNGATWTVNVPLSSQSPTSAECPYGSGTRVDNISTPTTYTCNAGTATVTSTGTPTETGFGGSCAPDPLASCTNEDDGFSMACSSAPTDAASVFFYSLTPGNDNGVSYADVSQLTAQDRLSFETYATTINVPLQSFTQGFPQDPSLTSWFGVCYEGSYDAGTSGNYQLVSAIDDGIAVYIDGALIVENYDGTIQTTDSPDLQTNPYQPGAEAGPQFYLSQGIHSVVVEYFNAWPTWLGEQLWIYPPNGPAYPSNASAPSGTPLSMVEGLAPGMPNPSQFLSTYESDLVPPNSFLMPLGAPVPGAPMSCP